MVPALGSRQQMSATDAATGLAHAIEVGAAKVGPNESSRYTITRRVATQRAECGGPYRVRIDRVGAIIIWCEDARPATGRCRATAHRPTLRAKCDGQMLQ